MSPADVLGLALASAATGGAVALLVHEWLAFEARRARETIYLRLLAKGAHPTWARHDSIRMTRNCRLSVFAGRAAR